MSQTVDLNSVTHFFAVLLYLSPVLIPMALIVLLPFWVWMLIRTLMRPTKNKVIRVSVLLFLLILGILVGLSFFIM